MARHMQRRSLFCSPPAPRPPLRLEVLEPRLLLSVSISGTVFDDANANGVRDGGEGGVAGATLFLDLNNNGELDGEPQAQSNAQGE